jgi:hypothetical protein
MPSSSDWALDRLSKPTTGIKLLSTIDKASEKTKPMN